MRRANGAVCSAETDHTGSYRTMARAAGSAFQSLSIPTKKSDKRNGQKKQQTRGGRNELEQ